MRPVSRRTLERVLGRYNLFEDPDYRDLFFACVVPGSLIAAGGGYVSGRKGFSNYYPNMALGAVGLCLSLGPARILLCDIFRRSSKFQLDRISGFLCIFALAAFYPYTVCVASYNAAHFFGMRVYQYQNRNALRDDHMVRDEKSMVQKK